MNRLEVDFIKLSECLVSPGWRLCLAATDMPGIHYNIGGTGRAIVGDGPSIDLPPHTLLIIPPSTPFRIEVDGPAQEHRVVESRWFEFKPGTVRRFVAGEGDPQVMLICGYFRAVYGASIELFANLSAPIVEIFGAKDELDHKLKAALGELMAQEIGSGAMTAALMKQVLVTLLRRSLNSADLWVERFSMLGDPQIARAFSDMIARPGAPHTLSSLANTSGLSRSAFIARFTEAAGHPPIMVLRQLRMRHAATLLEADKLSVEQAANAVGYSSRSSFCRAFRKIYGRDPSDWREGDGSAHALPTNTSSEMSR
ncbi:MAG TPA: AraC family transcriptional regulator [Stellaceae bacterium]|nr:AraC family transcriptional regulator [Stellaceae bacterium]